MLTKIVDHGYHLVLFKPQFPMLFSVLTNVCIFVLYSEENLFSWDQLYKHILWAHGRIERGTREKPQLLEPERPRFSSLLCVHGSEKSEGWTIMGNGPLTNSLQTWTSLCLPFPQTLAHYSEWQARVWTPSTFFLLSTRSCVVHRLTDVFRECFQPQRPSKKSFLQSLECNQKLNSQVYFPEHCSA